MQITDGSCLWKLELVLELVVQESLEASSGNTVFVEHSLDELITIAGLKLSVSRWVTIAPILMWKSFAQHKSFIGVFLFVPRSRLTPKFVWVNISSSMGSGCGAVGRAVASDTRGPRFESSLWQNLYVLSTVLRRRK